MRSDFMYQQSISKFGFEPRRLRRHDLAGIGHCHQIHHAHGIHGERRGHLSAVNQLLESETRQQLAGAFERFEMEFDPACEFGVGEERRLKRWLHASMPEALDNLRAPPPDRRKLENFRELIGIDRKRGIDGAIYVGGGAV